MSSGRPRLVALAAEYEAAHARLAESLAAGGLPASEVSALLDLELSSGERLQRRLAEVRREVAAARAETELRRAQIARLEEDLAAASSAEHRLRELVARRAEWTDERRRAVLLRRRALDKLRERSTRLEGGDLSQQSREAEEKLRALGRRLRGCQAVRSGGGEPALQTVAAELADLERRLRTESEAVRRSPAQLLEQRLASKLPGPGELAERAATRFAALRSDAVQAEQASGAEEAGCVEAGAGAAAALAALRWMGGELAGLRRWSAVAGVLQREQEAARAGQMRAFQTVEEAVRKAQADLSGRGAQREWIAGEAAGARAWMRLRQSDEGQS